MPNTCVDCNYYSFYFVFLVGLLFLHDQQHAIANKVDPADSTYQVHVHQVGEDYVRVNGPGASHRTFPTEGALIFDANLGPDWNYEIDPYRSHKEILQFLTLDSSTGHVYSKESFNCVNMYPVLSKFGVLHMYINAHTYSHTDHHIANHTVIPLTVYVYGPGCYQNHRRKNEFRSVLSPNYQLIVINVYQDQMAYLQKGENLLNLKRFIPASPRKKLCGVTVHNTRDYLVNPKNHTIIAKTLLEPKDSALTIHGDVEYECSKKHVAKVSFKILYHLHKNPSSVPKSKVTRRRRHRRATNNVAPYFDPDHYHKRVLEEVKKGVLVGIITATDTDTEDAGMLTYTLIASQDARSQSMFTIDQTSGRITTLTKLDREQIPRHYFTIIATDNGIPRKSGSASLTITVTDDNDHTPLFEKDIYTEDIPENIDPKSVILTVRATDKDEYDNARIQYSILNPDPPNDAFSIDPSLGTIQTRKALDRETVSFYNMIVQAMDQGIISKRRSSTATVQIIITDENDNYPQFESRSYTKSIPEDIDVSHKPIILNISATDKDENDNAKITYTISGGNSQDFFKINPLTGGLSLQKPLDYEDTNQYTLKIRAQDSGSPPKTNSTTVNIRVEDVNDNAPAFLGTYHESIMENKPINTSIRQVQAFDPDSGMNARMTFRIVDKPAYLPLTIDPKTGWIRTTAILDRENATSYRFTVEVKDSGDPPKSALTEVILVIRDANDNAPVFNPKVYHVNVSEEANPGVRVVIVTATDRDEGENAVLTYRITDGNIKSAFRIITSEGIILVAKTLNYREHSRYMLTVTATDPSGNQDVAEVVIQIIDTNRYRPKFQNTPYRISVSEDVPVGKSIYEVFALDKDVGENARITYSMDPTDVFAVDPNSGIVRTRAVLDREKQAGYTVSVTATDQGKPAKMDTTDLVITVEDENDNQPEFKKVRYSGTILESAEIGTRVVEISARDKDAGRNGQIYYTFKNGDDGNGDFVIDSTQGAIRTNKKLDRERVASYELVAYAVDRGSHPLSSSVIIDIKVEDVNDNKPMFEAQEIKVSIAENSPIGSTVAKLTANDPDVGENAEIEYMLKDEGDRDSFELSGRPGSAAIIISMVDMDYESDKKFYRLSLRAISEPLFSDVTVIIKVEDINDNKPQLNDFMIIVNNFVNYFPTGVIGKIPAYDEDEINRDTLIYSFISGNEGNLLHLNSSTGDITLDSRLNSDVARNGTLQVSVSDGLNEAKAVCHLYVRLVTDNMLRHSVTIRLNNMTSEAFLSPLYRFFINALATILYKDEKSIIIINIQDDTDVNAQILNVSVTVHSGISNGNDIFLTPQYLQEQIYLQRAMLANLSTSQVLPFDDNLCVMEPCVNFEVCMTRLRFGSAAPFIKSKSMLFRPIHPINSYQCLCPPGFTGMTLDLLCDVEVNLCYSSPCHMNSTCVQQEGGYVCLCPEGFTGKHCEVDMNTIYEDDLCPHKLCKPPSVCESISTGGFYCKGCPTTDHHNKFCELTTRQFFKGSYLTFPSLKRRQRFVISLNFTTQEKNGLLFYNGRYNEKHDFIALEVVNSKVQFSFSLGSNITTVQAEIAGGVSNGKWHQVTIEYHNRTATLSVGTDCDTGVAIHYRHLFDNYRCANRATMILDDKCAKVTEICHRLLDLTGPLQIGGLPRLPSKFLIENTDFVGCIKDFHIDHVLLDLNTSVAEKDTQPGCAPKKNFCISSPCKHGGICSESWGTFHCDCVEGTAGNTCEEMVDDSFKLKGDGYLAFNSPNLEHITFPWYNGISFRTRAENGVLLDITIQGGQKASIKLQDGYISYEHGKQKVVYSHNKVNDGQWHYVQTSWYQEELNIVLDYITDIMEVGEISNDIAGKSVVRIFIGAQHVNGAVVSNFFVGCVKNIRIGNEISKSLLSKPEAYNAESGCTMENPCLKDNPCRPNTCVDTWGQYKCDCLPGRIGSNCTDVCDNFNPCQNMGICHRPTAGQRTYTCECGRLQFGRYCQISLQQPCPAAWWGYPICGPCNCKRSKGFNPVCNKTTGSCFCKTNHYQPKGSDQCFPCNCYTEGSMGPSCDPITGQCRCHKGVIGRRCDSCSSRFAEVHEIGCRVVYDVCPRNFARGMWWDRTFINESAIRECPSGAIGDAKRRCTKTDSWLEPDLFNCTSLNFRDLHKQLQQIKKGSLKINTYVSKTLMRLLAKASEESADNFFGNDINIILNLIVQILNYENKQEGLSLTSEQDRGFIKNMLMALSYTYNQKYRSEWNYLNKKDGGAMVLTMLYEKYMHTLATSMALSQSWPFQIVSHNIVLAIDSIDMRNLSAVQIPKYDNIVPNSDMFDKDTNIQIPRSLLVTERSIEVKSPPLTPTPKGIIGYMMYRTLGEVLPDHYDESVRNIHERPMTVGTPVISLILQNRKHHIKGETSEPINITFKQLTSHNRSSPQCVYWQPLNQGTVGQWSRKGCVMIDRYELRGENYVTCSCSHLSTYAVLMDMTSIEYIAAGTVNLQIISYIGLTISMICLFTAFLIFFLLKNLDTNCNSIRLNLVLSIFISELFFLIGVARTKPEILCRIIAIFLHYFYISSFAWLFIEVLHIYRMLTEIRDINTGSMKFYYLVGYVIPGIIVGLAVGLYTDQYGTPQFCWLSTQTMFIWSFAGPIIVVWLIAVVTCILGWQASCKEKVHVAPEDLGILKENLLIATLLLPMFAATWVFALLSVNQDHLAFHYLFAIMACLTGVFIFICYVICSHQVQLEIKRVWYKLKGKKLEMDEALGGTRSTMLSRSALAYRNDSSVDGGLHRMNIGISTTSTTSRSTSKTSSGGLYKGDDYMRSTNSSTTSGHAPSSSLHHANTGIPMYDSYHPSLHDTHPDDPDTGEKTIKLKPDSDSDSDESVDRASLELASSHSSDEDEDIDEGPKWEIPKSKKVEEAKEQARQMCQKEKQKNLSSGTTPGMQHQPLPPLPPLPSLMSGPPPLQPGIMGTTGLGSSSLYGSNRPKFTRPHGIGASYYHASQGERDYIANEYRTTGPMVTFKDTPTGSPTPTRPMQKPHGGGILSKPKNTEDNGSERSKIQIITHNGSISSDSECSNSTTV